MSLMRLMPAFVGNAVLQVFNLTDTNPSHIGNNSTGEAGIRINGSDGTVDENINAVLTQIHPLSDWAIPNGDFTSYYAKCTVSGDAVSAGSASTGSFIALTSDRHWFYKQVAAGSLDGTWTIEISSDSGGTDIVATGTYVVHAEHEVS